MRIDWRERARLHCWANDNLFSQSTTQPENWPQDSRLRVQGQWPLYCGDHAIGLTSVYSIVNAFKLLLADVGPLQPAEEQCLMEMSWRFLNDRGAMRPQKGMRRNTILRLAAVTSFALSKRRGSWFCSEPIDVRGLKYELMDRMLERSVVAKRVVLILLGGGHYTVLRGYTSVSWLLFDALGRRWMQRYGCQRERAFIPVLSLSLS